MNEERGNQIFRKPLGIYQLSIQKVKNCHCEIEVKEKE